MNWVEGSILLFGGLVAVMGLGLPVAFAFLVLNVIGAILFLGGEPGLAQLARNAVQSITSFSLTPIPFFVLMGEVLFHTGVALKMFETLAAKGINIQVISTSEIKISVLVAAEYTELAVRALHTAYELDAA